LHRYNQASVEGLEKSHKEHAKALTKLRAELDKATKVGAVQVESS
jgi:hypothetical protein